MENKDTRETPSKSAKKRESSALQKLGEELARLDPEARKSMGLSEDLLEALAMHDRIKDKEGARRQRQYIGKLMRDEDIKNISVLLENRRNIKAAEVRLFHRAEEWRDRLLEAGEDSLPALLAKLREETAPAGSSIQEKLAEARSQKNAASKAAASRALFREIARLLKA